MSNEFGVADVDAVSALVTIGDENTTVTIGPERYEIPRGIVSLHRDHFTSDPPQPEDLTNAIGDMTDHLNDAIRELSLLSSASTVVVGGPAAEAIAAVERGAAMTDVTFVLTRLAAEDVFRTLATESAGQRRRNPGLPSHLVTTIAAGCCAVVAILRGLGLDEVTVQATTPVKLESGGGIS